MTRTSVTRRQIAALLAAFSLVLASAALVSGDERLDEPSDENVATLQQNEDEQEALEDADEAQEDADEAAEDAAEDAADAAEDAAEAAEEANDDCASTEEGTHGKTVCDAAQAWKTDGSGATRPPADQGAIVSGVAQQNHGADIASQIEANGGMPDAARDALANAGPTGNGPPGGGDDDEEEEDE